MIPAIAPARWLALDIETVAGRPEDIERYLRMHYSPPANMKTPEAIGRNWLEYRDKKTAKAGLLDQARVICVSLHAEEFGTRVLHSMRPEPLREDPAGFGWIEGFATRGEMLIALRFGLEALVGPDTVLVGHNVRNFDLPKLRWSYIAEHLRLPAALAGDQPVYDTMREYRRFSMVERPFVALADLLEEFGLPNHKSELDGSRIQEFHDAGRFDEILAYALQDAAIEAELYLRMTGQRDDAEVAP